MREVHIKDLGDWVLSKQTKLSKVITFGWTGSGIGKKYGFEETDGLIVRHGSQRNATICVLEIKKQGVLFWVFSDTLITPTKRKLQRTKK